MYLGKHPSVLTLSTVVSRLRPISGHQKSSLNHTRYDFSSPAPLLRSSVLPHRSSRPHRSSLPVSPRATCVKLAPRPRQPTPLAEVNLHFLCVRTVAFYNDLSWHLASFLCFVFIFISPSASARLPLRLAKSFHTLYVYTLTFLCRTQFRAPRPRVDKQLLRSRNDWFLGQNPQR